MKEIFSVIITGFLIVTSGCKHAVYTDHGLQAENPVVDDHEKHAEPDHTVIRLEKQPFSYVIRTGGKIMAGSKDIEVITAKSAGIVKFSNNSLFTGIKVFNGQHLFTVTGEQLAYDNTEFELLQLSADLEKAAANFERAQLLIVDRIITREQYLAFKNEYEKKLNEYNNLSGVSGKEGSMVLSPGNGYIRDIYVTEGQKVIPGQPLATLLNGRNLVLKAEVAPSHKGILSAVESASFRVGYSNKLFKTGDMKGRLISSGITTGDGSFYVPVHFILNYDPELIEGTYAEVYLIGKNISDAIVVPNSALMEEYGNLYVFIEDNDRGFVKRHVRTGNTDGEFTEITDGLSGGETIVATGAYNVRLSLMNNPAVHGHTH